MLVLVCYDIQTMDSAGAKRLRRVAKHCQNYGIRVQNSVFECVVSTAELTVLKHKLCAVMDAENDSIRFYFLGEKYRSKVEHFGRNEAIQMDEALIF